MCSKKPDTSGVNNAAKQTADTGQQALEWYKQEAARTQGQRDAAAAADLGVSQAAAAQMNAQTAQAAKDNEFLNGTVRPAQQQYIEDARNYGSAANQDAAAERAVADVTNAQAGQQTAAAQSLARMGYNPTVNATKLAATQALGQAAAATQARERTYNTGLQMEGAASGVGQQVSSDAAANNAGAATAGQVASGAGTASLNAATSGAALMGSGFGTALQGGQVSGNLYGQAAQISNANNNSGLWGAIGSLGGAAISKWSSKKLKTSGAAMPDEVALAAVRDANEERGEPAMSPAAEAREENREEERGEPKMGRAARMREERAEVPRGNPMTAKLARMSNDTWKYHDGVADGAVHVGPYAEEARAVLGDKVAPGGRKLNMRESAKVNGASIAELAARVDKLAKVLHG